MRALLITIITFTFFAYTGKKENQLDSLKEKSLFDFKVKAIDGTEFDFATLKGKKIMIVNTASQCDLTFQYKHLEELYTNYKDKGFVVIGFPANNFLGQEPGTDKEIATFCNEHYEVSFPLMSKISVKGEDMHPIYEFLTQKSKNGFKDSKVKWNFQKYLINRNGQLEKIINPKTLPTHKSVIKWIKKD